MSINIVIPVKDSCRSKSRLMPILGEAQRTKFARYLCLRTIEFFQREFPMYHLSVVTPSIVMAEIAIKQGVSPIMEPEEAGLSVAATIASKWSIQHGFSAQVIIPSDISELSSDEIKTLLNEVRCTPFITICPAADGGTHALMTSPPDAIEFAFGYASCIRHLMLAKHYGIPFKVLWLPKLSIDIDTPEDFIREIPRLKIKNWREFFDT